MANLAAVTGHLRRRLATQPLGPGRAFEVPRVILTPAGRDHVLDGAGAFWRALSFIDRAETFDTITDPGLGRQVGYALGLFHHLLADLPPAHLSDTLPGFHVTPGYLRHYDEVRAGSIAPASPEVAYCCQISWQRAGVWPLSWRTPKNRGSSSPG